jgi:hypothetical protein
MPDITTTLRAPNYASAPGSPKLGQEYYDTTVNMLFFWNGTIWRTSDPSGGTTGQVLAKNTGTNYDYGWKTFASAQVSSPSNPPAVTSTTGLHVGFGTATYGPFTFTPTVSGKVLIIVYAVTSGGTAAATVTTGLRYGTGTAPNNAAAPAGTATSSMVRGGTGYVANQVVPEALTWLATGLTLNTAYWVDLVLAATAGTAMATGGFFSAVELP